MPSSTPKKPQDRKPKTLKYGKSWKTNLVDLELPSGETCQVRRPGVQGLIKAGVLHSLDSLTSIVQTETIPKAEGKPPQTDVSALINDPEKFGEMMEQVDKIVIHVVTQPKVHTHMRPVRELVDEDLDLWENKLDADEKPVLEEIPDDERDPELVYVDYIDSMDKMFIMSFAVGGSADLQRFRQESEAIVGSLPPGEADAPAAK